MSAHSMRLQLDQLGKQEQEHKNERLALSVSGDEISFARRHPFKDIDGCVDRLESSKPFSVPRVPMTHVIRC